MLKPTLTLTRRRSLRSLMTDTMKECGSHSHSHTTKELRMDPTEAGSDNEDTSFRSVTSEDPAMIFEKPSPFLLLSSSRPHHDSSSSPKNKKGKAAVQLSSLSSSAHKKMERRNSAAPVLQQQTVSRSLLSSRIKKSGISSRRSQDNTTKSKKNKTDASLSYSPFSSANSEEKKPTTQKSTSKTKSSSNSSLSLSSSSCHATPSTSTRNNKSVGSLDRCTKFREDPRSMSSSRFLHCATSQSLQDYESMIAAMNDRSDELRPEPPGRSASAFGDYFAKNLSRYNDMVYSFDDNADD